MPDAFTFNYNFTLPEVGGSRDLWGGKDNANWSALDTILKALDTNKINKSGDTLSGAFTLSGLWNFTGAAPQIAGNAITTRAAIVSLLNTIEPIGTIKMWFGSIPSIPTGWKICDGTNGTPNLVNRVPIGTGDTYALGALGGSLNHDHGGVTGNHTLTVAEMPSHGHGVNDPGHAHSTFDPGHVHSYDKFGDSGSFPTAVTGATSAQASGDNSANNTGASGTGVTVQGATTGISISNNGGGDAHNHLIGVASNLPPYAAVHFIMKTALVV